MMVLHTANFSSNRQILIFSYPVFKLAKGIRGVGSPDFELIKFVIVAEIFKL